MLQSKVDKKTRDGLNLRSTQGKHFIAAPINFCVAITVLAPMSRGVAASFSNLVFGESTLRFYVLTESIPNYINWIQRHENKRTKDHLKLSDSCGCT